MRLRFVKCWALILLTWAASLAQCADISQLLFNTGMDSSRHLLTQGTVDPHYTLDGGTAFVVNHHPAWASSPNSMWVNPTGNATSGVPAGDFFYHFKFDLTGFDPATVLIHGRWMTDDLGTLLVNGTQVATSNSFTSFSNFTLNSGFKAGINDLTFKVNNGGLGPSGLLVEFLDGTANSLVLTLASSTVTGGSSVQGTVTESTGQGGTVTLSSSDTSVATVPPSVVIPSGQTSASFTVNTFAVNADTSVTITATLGARTSSQQLAVQQVRVPTVALTPSTLVGGAQSLGKVTISPAAAPGGTTITLSSSDNVAAQIPASVNIPAGQTAAVFGVKTTGVDFDTSVTIHAVNGGASATANLVVQKAAVSKLVPTVTSIVGGHSFAAAVTLNGFAGPSGATVTLGLNTAVTSGAASVKIAAQTSSRNVLVNTVIVASRTAASLSASLDGITVTTTVIILPASLASLDVPSTAVGGTAIKITLGLDGGAASGGAVVSLFSSSTSLTLPATVTVPAGQTTFTFNATTKTVTAATRAAISATFQATTISRAVVLTP